MTTPSPVQLADAAAELLRSLAHHPSGRAARTLTPEAGAPLKQTLLALAAGTRLQDHRTPGRATIEVLVGRVRLTVGDDEVELVPGSWAQIPPQVHGLVADRDSVALLTVVSRGAGADG
jgi:quercetin dioxygenase-like cupin family protein